MTRRACLVAVGLCALATTAAAQPPSPAPPSPFLSVTMVTVRPDSVPAWEDYVKKIAAGAAKAAVPGTVNAFQVVSGGPGFTYVFTQGFSKWAEVDSFLTPAQIATKAFGDVEGAAMVKAGRAAIVSVSNQVARYLPDLSTRPGTVPMPAKYLFLFRTQVKPEMVTAYEEYLAKAKAAAEQTPGTPMVIRRITVQGPANFYTAAIPFNTYAERDAFPTPISVLKKVYGDAEGQKWNEQRLRSTDHAETWVLMHRPDLSRSAATAR